MQGDHGADNWANDWVAQAPHDSEQGPDADVQYVGASPSTVAAAAEVWLFVADSSSPKFYAALAEGFITTAEPLSSSTPAPTAETVVVLTESPPALVPRKEIRDRKKKGGASSLHAKRPRRKSPSMSPPAASVSLPLPSSRPESRTSPASDSSGHLRRAAAVAADQRLVKQVSPARRRASVKSLSFLSSAVEPEPLKAVVPATKPNHSESIASAKKPVSYKFVLASSSYSSELSDDSEVPLAALSEPAPPRKKKSIGKKNVTVCPAAGASARRKAPLPAASASAESPEPTAAPVTVAHTARFGSSFDIDPAKLPYYISVVGRKGAARSQKDLYFDVTKGLSRFVQPGSEIQVISGISAVLGNASAALREFSRDLREFIYLFIYHVGAYS